MARIHIFNPTSEPTVTLMVNERKAVVPVHVDTDLDDFFIPALADSNNEFRFVEAQVATEGEASAGGDSGAPSPEPLSPEAQALLDEATAAGLDLGILDQSVPKVAEALDGLTAAQLSILRRAEEAGKTRSGVIKAIDAKIEALPPADPPKEGEGDDTAETEGEGNEEQA